MALYRHAKKVEGEHVPQQVHVIMVNETRADKPVVLTFRFYQVRIHHQPTLKFVFVECIKAYRYGNADQNDSNAHEY